MPFPVEKCHVRLLNNISGQIILKNTTLYVDKYGEITIQKFSRKAITTDLNEQIKTAQKQNYKEYIFL